MTLSRNRLYLIFLFACIAGYVWVAWNVKGNATHTPELCAIKKITSLPCPSCGTTRSVVLLSQGNFNKALVVNPMGYVAAFIMLVLPVWMVTDLLARRQTLFQMYRRTELFVSRRWNMILLILLVTSNWIWNIIKGL